jgi:hypothetical protein
MREEVTLVVTGADTWAKGERPLDALWVEAKVGGRSPFAHGPCDVPVRARALFGRLDIHSLKRNGAGSAQGPAVGPRQGIPQRGVRCPLFERPFACPQPP